MKKLISALCFMFALSPLAYAQDKAKMDDKKAAPAAESRASAGRPTCTARRHIRLHTDTTSSTFMRIFQRNGPGKLSATHAMANEWISLHASIMFALAKCHA